MIWKRRPYLVAGLVSLAVNRAGGRGWHTRRATWTVVALVAAVCGGFAVPSLSASSAEGLRLSATAVAGPLTPRVDVRSIDACPPPGGASTPEVEVILFQGDDAVGGGTFAIDALGHWRGIVPVSDEADPGPVIVEADCYAFGGSEGEEGEAEADPYASYLPVTVALQAVTSAASCPGTPATITGTPGPDRLFGTPGGDVIHGLGGNDFIAGLGGDDLVCGGTGDDDVSGGDANDRLFGESGNDRLAGGIGGDGLFGGPGADDLAGGSDNDALVDRAGQDRFSGGPGGDALESDDLTGGDLLASGPTGQGDTCMSDGTDAVVGCTA